MTANAARFCALAAVLTLLCLPVGTLAQGTIDAEGRSADLQLLLGVLKDENIDAGKRRNAALSLLRRGWPEAVTSLNDLLKPEGDANVQRLIAQAVAAYPDQPPRAFADSFIALLDQPEAAASSDFASALGRFRDADVTGSIINIATDESVEPARRAALIGSLGYHRSKYTAGVLINLLHPDQPPAVRASAAGALEQLTGNESMGDSYEQWQAWWDRHHTLADADWLHMLLDNFVSRADALAKRNQLTAQKLLDSQRQLYLATPVADRPALLSQMLADKSEPTRRLAIDLAGKRLIDQQPIEGQLLESIRTALDDSSPVVREQAARLIRDLRDSAGADRVAQLIADEGDAQVLHAYLLVMTDLPRAEAVDQIIKLLSVPSMLSDAAGALAKAVDGGLLAEEQLASLRAHVHSLLAPTEAPAPKVIELIGRIAKDEDDWRRVKEWLSSEDDAIRTSAARVWATSAKPLDPLAARADDPLIQPILIVEATERGNSPEVLHALAQHRPEQAQIAEAWERSLIALAGRVSPDAVLDACALLAAQEASPELRGRLLTAAIEPGEPADPQNNPPQDPPTGQKIAQLLLARADVRVMAGQAALALSDLRAIDALTDITLSDEQQRTRQRLLITASLATGEVDTAVQQAQQLVDSLSTLDETAQRIAANNVHQIFLDAADQSAQANQYETSQKIIDGLSVLNGPALSEDSVARRDNAIKKVKELAAAAAATAAAQANANANDNSATTSNGSSESTNNTTTATDTSTTDEATEAATTTDGESDSADDTTPDETVAESNDDAPSAATP